MQLDQKVLSYDLSKKLVEKGIVLDTEFCYDLADGALGETKYAKDEDDGFGETGYTPAPLLVEMLEVLPAFTDYGYLGLMKGQSNWECQYITYGDPQIVFYGLNPTNACGKMLLHLLENGHITLEDINK